MKKRKFDFILFVMLFAVIIAGIGETFFDYDATKFVLTLTMIFIWDIGETLKRTERRMKGDG